MVRRSLQVPTKGGGCAAALAILTWGASLSVSAAAETEFRYSGGLEESYFSDIFRIGGDDPPGDYVTGASLTAGWSARTSRSTTQLQYTPEYFHYAQYSDLDHLEHAERASWSLRTGPRSTLKIRQGFLLGEEQRGFYDYSENIGEAIQPRNERWVADLVPSYAISLSRSVDLDVRGTYRISRYQSENLVDSDEVGIQISPTVRIGRASRIGGVLSLDTFDFISSMELGPRIDSFVRLEALWSASNGRGLNSSVSAGMFRASGDGFRPAVEPSYHLTLGYRLLGNEVALHYEKGYSVDSRAARVLGTQSGSLVLGRQWRSGLRTSARASYLQQETFSEFEDGTLRRDGLGVDLEVSYRWKSGLQLGARYGRLKQERITSSDLDYDTAVVTLRFRPARPSELSAPQGSGT